VNAKQEAGRDGKAPANFRTAEWDVSEEKTGRWSWWRVARNSGEWLGIVASGEWRPVVGRTAGSGDPRRTSECEERELAMMEKCQNKANLLVTLVVLIVGML
jgi:hypothetical protein